MNDALNRYRVMAYVVGVLLAVLVLIAVPLKYFAGQPELVTVVGFTHGWMFLIYVVVTLQLGWKRRWPLPRTALVLSAGLVPFLSFVVERQVTRDERARL